MVLDFKRIFKKEDLTYLSKNVMQFISKPYHEQSKTVPSERKHVTILFTDLSGYSAITERLDPEEVRSVLGSVFKKIARIVEAYDGFIERYIGDSVMAVFGIPGTHEDDPAGSFPLPVSRVSANPVEIGVQKSGSGLEWKSGSGLEI